MSNRRKIRELNKTSGQFQRPKKDWGRTAPLRIVGRFTKADIRRWLVWRKEREEKQ